MREELNDFELKINHSIRLFFWLNLFVGKTFEVNEMLSGSDQQLIDYAMKIKKVI